MKNFLELIRGCLTEVREIMPWDLEERREANPDLMIVDVREPYEFDAMHISGAINVPRGILESACEWDYEETEPEAFREFEDLDFALSLGVDYELFLRDSYYEFADIGDVHQKAPILKIFASWNPSRGDWFE